MKFSVLLISYLIGSIPFSYLITRIVSGKDIRDLGSGNVGATNVMRTAGRWPAIIALLLDFAKGSLCVIVVRKLTGSTELSALAGLFAMIGHSYPLFLGFRGGKSVATGGGAFSILAPYAMLSSIGIFILMVLSFRIVSLGSIIAAASFPLFAWLFGANKDVVLWGGFGAALIIVRHKANIQRLMQGKEKKVTR